MPFQAQFAKTHPFVMYLVEVKQYSNDRRPNRSRETTKNAQEQRDSDKVALLRNIPTPQAEKDLTHGGHDTRTERKESIR